MRRSEELSEKLARVQRFLSENALDGVVLSRADNFAWLGCGANNLVNNASETGVAAFVVRGGAVTLVANNIESERMLVEELGEIELAGVETFPWHEPSARAAIISRLACQGAFAADDGTEGLPALPAGFQSLRFSLTRAELDRYRQLGRDTSSAMEDAARAVEAGMTEAEGAALLQSECQMRGIVPVVLLVAADERIRRWRHPIVKDTPIRRQAMLVLCGRRQGLIAVLTRIVHFGELPADLVERHEAVCRVDAAMIAATRPGSEVSGVLAEAQQAYAQAGYPDEWRFHHQGGAIGYRPREYIANPTCREVVQPRQAFGWNPSICGTKSEDTILADAEGPSFITAPSAQWPALRMERSGLKLARADILVK